MAKKKADAMIHTFTLVTAIITSIGVTIKAIAELIDFVTNEEE